MGRIWGALRVNECAGCLAGRPLPMTPCPLTLALSHGGERGLLVADRGRCGRIGAPHAIPSAPPRHSECATVSFRVQRGISPLPRWERVRVRVIGVDMGTESPLPRWERVRVRVNGADMGALQVNTRWLFGGQAPPLDPVPPHPSPLPRRGEGIVGSDAPPSSFCHVVAVVTLRGTFPPRSGGNPTSSHPRAYPARSLAPLSPGERGNPGSSGPVCHFGFGLAWCCV